MALSCLPAIAGCAGADDRPDQGSSEQALWSEASVVRWPYGEVRVCFLPTAFSSDSTNGPHLAAWRNDVKTWVTTLLQPFAQLSFTDFVACPPNPTSDWIQINVTKDDHSNSYDQGRVLNNHIDFGIDSIRQEVVLHEFMHKLGFAHEFDRSDSDGVGCPPREPDTDPVGRLWTPYDRDSIMNIGYCKDNKATVLSPLDRAGLRAAYGDERAPELDGSVGRRLAVGRQADGRLEVFYAGPNQALFHNIQSSPGGSWSGPIQLGGYAKQLAVAPDQDGRLEVFYIGTNDALYHNFQTTPNGSWSGELVLGGAAKQIALGRNTNGALELLYVGTNDAIYHNWQNVPNGAWHGEALLGGAGKQISVARNEDGRLEVFYIGTDDVIYHRWQLAASSAWSGEASLGNNARQLVVARNEDGRLELFYIGPNDSIYHRWQYQGDWYPQSYLFGSAKRLAVARNPDGRLEVFYVGTNDAIYHDYQVAPAGDWNHEQALGGAGRDVIAGRNRDGRVEIAYIGTNGLLYHNWQTSSGWSGEAVLGGDVNDPPAPSCPANGACLTASECHHEEGTNIGQLSCPVGNICCTF